MLSAHARGRYCGRTEKGGFLEEEAFELTLKDGRDLYVGKEVEKCVVAVVVGRGMF